MTHRGSLRASLVSMLAVVLVGCSGQAGPWSGPPRGSETVAPAAKPAIFQTTDEMIAVSELIVVGTIQQVLPTRRSPVRPKASETQPLTESLLRVEEVLKGTPPGPVITLRQLWAGTIDGKTYKSEGTELYQQGERVLVFLTEAVPGGYNSFWFQGEFRVVGTGPNEQLVSRFSNAVSSLTLPALREQVRRVPDRSVRQVVDLDAPPGSPSPQPTTTPPRPGASPTVPAPTAPTIPAPPSPSPQPAVTPALVPRASPSPSPAAGAQLSP